MTMKKIYFVLLGLAAGLSTRAQVTLTQANHAFVAGDSYQMYQCDSTGVTAGATGPNQVWTYSAIPTRTGSVFNYSVTAYTGSSFPGSSVSVASSTADAAYYSSTATDQKYHGGNIVATPVIATVVYSNAATTAVYPMTANGTATSAITGSINILAPLPTSGNFVGTSTVTADASGTMMLPGGANATFSNVIRVNFGQLMDFTVSSGFVTGSVRQNNYDYYTPGFKAPIFSISMTTVVTTISAATTQTVVKRNKSAVTTNTLSDVGLADQVGYDEILLFVYPNPASSDIHFATTSLDAKFIEVYDITGKKVEQVSVVNGKANIELNGYNKGFYIYKVMAEGGKNLKSGRFTVID